MQLDGDRDARICVVDDNRLDRERLREFLVGLGRVDVFADAETALASFRETPPDVVDAAMAVESEPGPGDAVERSRGRVGYTGPGLVAAAERSLPDPAIDVAHECSPLRHGQAFDPTVGKAHREFQLAGDGVVHPSPGVQSIDPEVGRQRFFFAAHGPLGPFALAPQGVRCVG